MAIFIPPSNGSGSGSVQISGNYATNTTVSSISGYLNYRTIQSVNTSTVLNNIIDTVLYTGNTPSVLTLPPANTNAPDSVIITIKHFGTNNLNIAPQPTEFIENGAAGQSILMRPQQALEFISNPSTNTYFIS